MSSQGDEISKALQNQEPLFFDPVSGKLLTKKGKTTDQMVMTEMHVDGFFYVHFNIN